MEFNPNTLYLLGSTISLVVMAYLAIREARSKRDTNVSVAVKNLADALNLSTGELSENLAQAAKLRDELEVVTAQVAELEKKQKKDLQETASLRNDYANAQRRIIHLEDMVITIGEYADVLKQALQQANIPVPVNGELMESVHRLKLQRSLGK